jgi:hypothetical protein
MARNRKAHSTAIRLGPALKAVIICLLLGASSVGYVLQKNKILELSYQIGEQQKRLKRLESENTLRAAQYRDLLSPNKLEARLKRFHLGLSLPNPGENRVIWLTEPTLQQRNDETPKLVVWENTGSPP